MPRPRKAVSVGCGVGTKEMDLMAAGEIDTFECYETSGATAELGKKIAEERGLVRVSTSITQTRFLHARLQISTSFIGTIPSIT